jgi:plasmid stability protein
MLTVAAYRGRRLGTVSHAAFVMLLAQMVASNMPAILVRDLPADTVAALKRRAARNGHSMQREVHELLTAATAEHTSGARPRPLRLVTVSTGRSATFSRDDFYDDDDR